MLRWNQKKEPVSWEEPRRHTDAALAWRLVNLLHTLIRTQRKKGAGTGTEERWEGWLGGYNTGFPSGRHGIAYTLRTHCRNIDEVLSSKIICYLNYYWSGAIPLVLFSLNTNILFFTQLYTVNMSRLFLGVMAVTIMNIGNNSIVLQNIFNQRLVLAHYMR